MEITRYCTEIAEHLATISANARHANNLFAAAECMERGECDGLAAVDKSGEAVKLLVLHGGMANAAADAARETANEYMDAIPTHAAKITVLCHELCAELDRNRPR